MKSESFGTDKPALAAWVMPVLFVAAAACAQGPAVGAIDRHALVTRHNVTITRADPRTPLQVGNGEFAFSADVTGLQTFGSANTMSQWGWHSFPLPQGMKAEDFRMTEYDVFGRTVGYATKANGQEKLYAWLRENPHRLNLGRISLHVDGRAPTAADVKTPVQTLDLWSGLIVSRYVIAGQAVTVETCCHPSRDAVAVKIESPLVSSGRLSVEFAFPYGSPGVSGADWARPGAHQTKLAQGETAADFVRTLDADTYFVRLAWQGKAELASAEPHKLILAPARESKALEFVCAFSPGADSNALPVFEQVKSASAGHWKTFWSTGGAIDLSASKDTRWKELERRIVLSQYLTAIQSAGSLPPQESCLVNNGWNGKFHLEMHWWHAVHFALWDRWELFDRSLGWYRRTLPVARKLAQSQGYRGARWPKMVGPDGRDAPSGVGPLLIWQQPHPIYYAFLDYRLHPQSATLEKWKDVVFETAEFLASFAHLDPNSGRYVLGPPIKTVPENTDPLKVWNPGFELSYWRFGLRTAQMWREKLGLPREPQWDKVLNNLAPLPEMDGVYLSQEGMADTYTKWNWEHPSLIGPLGMIPGDGVNPQTMKATVCKVMATWQLEKKTWGWDFPMLAMAAARNGEPGLAVDALLHPAARNQIEINGFSTGGPYPYFPTNGGLLSAAAMMAAGWDGAPAGKNAPGFPDDGSWTVRWENLKPLP